ncbi:MAG: divergent polysaccharide deacetylase family protein [Alphaproteobacteria bacterium]|nr:divergent polysaccharide deacetylase family protein [Alphaproteobacteria bacterium]
MYGGDDPAIGPARRPLGPWLSIAAILLFVLAILGGIAIWMTAFPHHGRMTRVEMKIPPPLGAGGAVDPSKAGNAALLEHGATGPLPKVASDGRAAWQVYARPFDRSERRPRIAIVISGLGQSAAETDAAIKLPGQVTLAFSPYSPDLPAWIEKARAGQHELLLTVPMEPADFPQEDPGPYTLLTSLTPKQNLDRLEWVLGRASGYVGLTNYMGSRFTTAPDSLRPIIEVLKGRGLLLLETRASSQSILAPLADEFSLPHAVNDRDFDSDLSRAGIDKALSELEQVARQKGSAIGTGSAYPVTLDRVALWADTLAGKDLILAPVSALVVEKSETGDKSAAKEAAQ